MEFKSSAPKYTNRFMGHFIRFIKEYNLFDQSDSLLVAVSGGVDSMALIYAISQLQRYGYSIRVRAVHINHGTRVGQDEEEALVVKFCQALGVECITDKFEDLTYISNFEYRARQKRYESFYKIADKKDKIVLAHHIDDSFEWTMLQSLRSSSIEGLIGIPLKNHRVIRPFMCATKEHILKFAQSFDLPFINDPTNEQIKYERNFIRNEVIPAFSDRHKKYLKHYVYRHNEIARRMGVHLVRKNTSSFFISYAPDSVLIYNLGHVVDYSGIEQQVLNAIKYLHPQSRGSLNQQLEKIRIALENKKIGPLNLVGKFKVYLDYNLLLITDKSERELKLSFDDYKTFSFDEFQNYLSDKVSKTQNHFDFPFIVLVKNNYIEKRNFKISFNNKSIEKFCTKNTSYYPAIKLLREWSKKRNRHRVLRLNFLHTV